MVKPSRYIDGPLPEDVARAKKPEPVTNAAPRRAFNPEAQGVLGRLANQFFAINRVRPSARVVEYVGDLGVPGDTDLPF